MTLFIKKNCRLCDQLTERFDLEAMQVKVEVLDADSPEALAQLAWHCLPDSAKNSLPLLVLSDSSAIADFANIEHKLAARAIQHGIGYIRSGGGLRHKVENFTTH